MKTVETGTAHQPVGADAPGIPNGACGSLVRALAVCVGVLSLALASEPARADDFDRLLHSAGSSGTVSVLVTGWHAITGGEADQGSSGGGLVAITGDEFVKKLEGSSRGLSVTRRYRNFPVLAMEMDTDALQAAKAHGSGVEIWEDPVLEPLLSQSVDMVGAREVWSQGYTGRGRYVVVIDTGVDAHHPFLAGERVLEGCYADVCPNGASTMLGRGAAAPVGSHGTHVAGIIVGGTAWGDFAGVAPGLHLIMINVHNRAGPGMNGRNILAALDKILTVAKRFPGAIGAVNMSLGAGRDRSGPCYSQIWSVAAEQFLEVGVPVVVAAGNDSSEQRAAPVGFPACIEGFISVGAVTKSGHVAAYSNSGPALDLMAPGSGIQSSVVETGSDRYGRMSGTSMAAPHVAAAMALLKQAAPHRSVEDLLQMLKSTGRSIWDSRSGIDARLIDIGEVFRDFGLAAAGSGAESDVAPELQWEEDSGTDGGNTGWTSVTE